VKIGIDTHAAEQGGSGNCTYIRGLVRGLARLHDDAEYVLYAIDPGHPFYAELRGHPRFTIRRLWPRQPVARIPLSLALGSFRDRLDVLHVQYVGPPVHRGALVVTIHDLAFLAIPQSFPRLQALRLRWQVRANARRAARVITVSEYSRRDLVEAYGISDDRLVVIHHAPDPSFVPVRDRAVIDALRRTLGIAHRYVLCVGRLNPRKNLLGVLRAFERVRPQLAEPTQLVIAGTRDHQADRLDQAIAASPCRADVLRVGYVPDETLPALYSGAALFVYPSFFEGFGFPPLEAMACGVPVVCSWVTSLPEVVGEAVLLVDPSSVEDIATGMRRVLTDPALRAALVAKGLRRAAEFTWDRTAERTREVYGQAARIRHPDRVPS
jgi:glycosyltransferase involved in cell wall biosynthesis